MTPQALFDELETLTFAARWKRMLALGRQARADRQAQALIAALEASGDFYSRQLALMAAHGSGESRNLVAALTGPSQALFGMAISAAVRYLDDGELAAAIAALPPRRRKVVVIACARAGRRAAVTAAFDSFDMLERARFLRCATPAFCAAELSSERSQTLAGADWRALARWRPLEVHSEIAARIAAGGLPDPLARALPGIIAGLALHAEKLALDLLRQAAGLENFRPSRFDDVLLLRLFAARAPAAIADYFLAHPTQSIPQLPPRMLAALDPERRRKLYRLSVASSQSAGLRRLPPSLRAELYANEQWERERSKEGALPVRLVVLLPVSERHAEARRAWKAPQWEAYPQQRLAYLAFLPFEEALREAEPYLRQPDGELREKANAALIACARFASPYEKALDHARARRNEQDPVRRAMLREFAALPPSRWTPAHLPVIAELLKAALSASDASSATFAACLTWLLRLGLADDPPLAFIVANARPLIEKLGGLHGVTGMPDVASQAVVRALAPTFASVAEVWRGRSQSHNILALAASLGSRIEAAPQLLDIVESLTADPRRPVAEAALAHLSRMRDRSRFLALAPKLFGEDPGWVLCPAMQDHLDRRRQDLLAGVLRPRQFIGRFSSGDTRLLPTFSAFRFWTARQQETYADSLVKIAVAPGRDAQTLRRTITALARMPAIDIGPLASFAHVDAPDKAVRDMALWALGEADAARGAPELLRALGDERARIAIYALRRIVLDLPAAEAMRLVAGFSLHPVTVGKEAIRLAGDLRTGQACEWLNSLNGRDDLHADLKLALMRAYWSYLERPQTWDALDAAAHSERLALARAAVAIPQERLGAAARLRLARHQALLLAHPHALVRLEGLRRIEAMPDRAGASLLEPALLAALASEAPEAIRLAVSALLKLGASAEAGARCAGIDDPLAFQSAVGELQRRCELAQPGAAEAGVAFVQELAGQGRRLGAALRLALCALPPERLQGWIENQTARLHPDALADALTALRTLAAGPRGETLLGCEPNLARSPEPWARRLGLAVVAARGAAKGWTQALRQRLDAYAADPSAWIAEAHERILPPAASDESVRPAP